MWSPIFSVLKLGCVHEYSLACMGMGTEKSQYNNVELRDGLWLTHNAPYNYEPTKLPDV